MIYTLTQEDIQHYPDLFFSQHQLRCREFIDRQDYAVKKFRGREFDQYDNMAATYLVYSEDGRNALGVSRLSHVSYGCMLQDHFAHMVEDRTLFHAPGTWEATRFCCDSREPPHVRARAVKNLLCAYIEFGLANNIECLIGLMPTLLLRLVFERNGIRLDRLGEVKQIGSQTKVQAASIPITRGQLRRVQDQTGLRDVLDRLQNGGENRRAA